MALQVVNLPNQLHSTTPHTPLHSTNAYQPLATLDKYVQYMSAKIKTSLHLQRNI